MHLCSVVKCPQQNSATKQEAQEQVMGKQNSNDERASRLISDTSHYLQIPRGYIRPPSERPRFNEVALSHSIPVVDLGDLHGPSRKSAIDKIRRACKEDGFFQIVNHGVQEKVIQSTLDVAKEFFTMPAEYRRPFYSDDPSCAVRLSTSFNVQKEQIYNWRDYLRHHCYPLENFVNDWPSEPRTYREVVSKYCTEVRALVLNLLAAISESLGLEPDFLNKALGKHAQHMAVNYYPRCPNPELTFGLPGHTDPNVLTVLLQGHVSGLQVYNNGQWCAVQPIPNAFVVNVGDQLQMVPRCHLAGVVADVGEGVSKFKKGDEVYDNIQDFTVGNPKQVGSLAELTVAEEHLLALKPSNLSFEEAASLPLALLTALQAFHTVDFQKGQSVFIVGGAGSVGTLAIQLAKHVFEASKIVSTCSTGKVEFVKSLGADLVVDYTEQSYEQMDEKFDFVFDTIGESFKSHVVAKEGGKIVDIALFPPHPRAVNVLVKPQGSNLEWLGEYIESGKLKPVIDLKSTCAFSDIMGAFKHQESGRARRKIFISPITSFPLHPRAVNLIMTFIIILAFIFIIKAAAAETQPAKPKPHPGGGPTHY